MQALYVELYEIISKAAKSLYCYEEVIRAPKYDDDEDDETHGLGSLVSLKSTLVLIQTYAESSKQNLESRKAELESHVASCNSEINQRMYTEAKTTIERLQIDISNVKTSLSKYKSDVKIEITKNHGLATQVTELEKQCKASEIRYQALS